jgi:hypothetical protein
MSSELKPLVLSTADLVFLNNALNDILNGPDAIEAWEFQMRTGVERSEALELLERIRKQLDAK